VKHEILEVVVWVNSSGLQVRRDKTFFHSERKFDPILLLAVGAAGPKVA